MEGSKLSTYEQAIEIIGQAVIDFMQLDKSVPEEKEALDAVNQLLDTASEAYVLVQWPDSQKYMEEDWFDEEAILDVEARFSSSAYFIPLKRVLN